MSSRVFCQCGHEYGSHKLDGRCGLADVASNHWVTKCPCTGYQWHENRVKAGDRVVVNGGPQAGEIGYVDSIDFFNVNGNNPFLVLGEIDRQIVGDFNESELRVVSPRYGELSSLVNGTAICERYGVAKSTLSGWQTRNGFPKPMDIPGLIGSKVWDCSEVEKWHDNWTVGRR